MAQQNRPQTPFNLDPIKTYLRLIAYLLAFIGVLFLVAFFAFEIAQ